jgi:hypothetical protein
MSQQPYPDELEWWQKVFDVEVARRYAQADPPKPYPNSRSPRWGNRTAYDICAGMTKEASMAKHLRALEIELGLDRSTPGQPTNRPLVGPLRVENKLFCDDTGPRRVFFCSWFPALCILRNDPAEFERQINAIAAANYQGIRVFLAVGGWSDFWDGREVAPAGFTKWKFSPESGHLRPAGHGGRIDAWPDHAELLRTLLRACKARKLRLHLSCGDMQIICPDPGRELDLHRQWARICAEEGGLEVVALAGETNEYPMNRFGGDGAQSVQQMGRVLQAWREAIPGVLTAQGAILSEEADKLYESSQFGQVCISHTTREPFSLCIKRTLGLVYWEGNYRHFPKPFWQGEPAGPAQDSYQRQDDPANLTALYAMHALTGQASNQFAGPAVRSREPLECAWGFKELPKILAVLPEDVATWQHANGPNGAILYWFKGQRFATATIKDWNSAPPRPVREWSLFAGDAVTQGTGNPPRATGLIVGTFA